jgi:hypothetical protein
MPFKTDKTSAIELRSLRPAPLSYHSVSGFTWVLRENGQPVRIHELVAGAAEENKYRLLGPEGVVEVKIQIGGFQNTMSVTVFSTNDGQHDISFATSITYLRLGQNALMDLTAGVFNGFRMVNGERVYVEMRATDTMLNKAIDHYAYSITPCALYLGAGRKPVFLPFEVS